MKAVEVEGGFGVLEPARGVEVRVEVEEGGECLILLADNGGEFGGVGGGGEEENDVGGCGEGGAVEEAEEEAEVVEGGFFGDVADDEVGHGFGASAVEGAHALKGVGRGG